MIVSPEHQFIFVHIFKTAGTSIKRAIRRYAMPEWQEQANTILKKLGIPQFGPDPLPDHMTASQAIDELGRDEFNRYFSFAFVRNPWDWEVSHYKYILKKRKHELHDQVTAMGSFESYLDWRCDGRFQLQQEFLVHEGQQVVDFVGRFETLKKDFEFVCNTLGIESELPKLNATQSSDYCDFYTPRTIKMIEETYADDIELFQYEFKAA